VANGLSSAMIYRPAGKGQSILELTFFI
jgi:hypothetical protein